MKLEIQEANWRRQVLYEDEFGKAKAIGAKAANTLMGRVDANAIIAFASFTEKAAKHATAR